MARKAGRKSRSSDYLDKEQLGQAAAEAKRIGRVTEDLARFAKEIFVRYAAKKAGGRHEDIEEIVSLAFVRLMNPGFLDKIEPGQNIFSYLTGTCNYAALDHFRAQHSHTAKCEVVRDPLSRQSERDRIKPNVDGAWERAMREHLNGAEDEIVTLEKYENGLMGKNTTLADRADAEVSHYNSNTRRASPRPKPPMFYMLEFADRRLYFSRERPAEVWDGEKRLPICPRPGGGLLLVVGELRVSLSALREKAVSEYHIKSKSSRLAFSFS